MEFWVNRFFNIDIVEIHFINLLNVGLHTIKSWNNLVWKLSNYEIKMLFLEP